MVSSEIDPQLHQEFEAVAAGTGCELLAVEHGSGVLRLVLDAPEGVTLANCEEVARQASALLDLEDFGSGRYTLEVSSPGLDRKLYRPEDYERFSGERVKVSWQTAEMDHKRTIAGRLGSYSSGSQEIEVLEEPNGERHTLALADVLQARLDPEL